VISRKLKIVQSELLKKGSVPTSGSAFVELTTRLEKCQKIVNSNSSLANSSDRRKVNA
jgi:hypothetical protein